MEGHALGPSPHKASSDCGLTLCEASSESAALTAPPCVSLTFHITAETFSLRLSLFPGHVNPQQWPEDWHHPLPLLTGI